MIIGIILFGGEIFWRSRNVHTLEIEKCMNQLSTTVSSNFFITTNWPCVIQGLKSRETRSWSMIDWQWIRDGGPPQILAISQVVGFHHPTPSFSGLTGEMNARNWSIHLSGHISWLWLYTHINILYVTCEQYITSLFSALLFDATKC